MVRRTAEEAAQTRARLVEAGVAYFAKNPYGEASLEDLVAGLGVTRGALYHHFGSKQGFFEAVVEYVLHRLSEEIVQSAESAADAWSGLEAGCCAFLRAATEESFRRIALIDAPAVLGWAAWKQLDDRTTARTLREGLRELRSAGELSVEDVVALTPALSGAMNEISLWVAAQRSPRRALPRAEAIILELIRGFRRRSRRR